MDTMWTLHPEEESLFQVEKEDIRALLNLWYIDYLWGADEADLKKEIIRLEGQLRNVREPKEETWKELNADALIQKIETIELIETIRQKIQKLVIRMRNEFLSSYFYVTPRGASYEKDGENTRWKKILKRIPDLPYKEIVPSIQWVLSGDDGELTRDIPREYFSGPEFVAWDV